MDAFGLLVPLTFDGAKITPWGMYSMIGPNTFRDSFTSRNGNWSGNLKNMGAGNGYVNSGLFPVGGARHKDFSNANHARSLSSYGDAWWGGISGDITAWDPFRIAFDFEYGSVTWDDDGRLNRQGWFATLLAEYKLDWATPGIYGWYASGDDDTTWPAPGASAPA